MSPEPLYQPDRLCEPAYQLRYGWTGWPSQDTLPPKPDREFFDTLAEKWESDGIRLLEFAWSRDSVQVTASVRPGISPVLFTARAKGRLQHALRQRDSPVRFSRKLAMHSIGAARRDAVEKYVADQVAKERLADSSFAERLEANTVVDSATDLSRPVATDSGRYWYNLHVVFVMRDGYRITRDAWLHSIRDQCRRIAEAKGYRMSALSVMPDHVHLALGGDVEASPEEIALGFMNNVAYGLGQTALWKPSYYAGTIGEYDMDAVRTKFERTDGSG